MQASRVSGMQEAQQLAEAGAAAARQELARYALESVAGVSVQLTAASGHAVWATCAAACCREYSVCFLARAVKLCLSSVTSECTAPGGICTCSQRRQVTTMAPKSSALCQFRCRWRRRSSGARGRT